MSKIAVMNGILPGIVIAAQTWALSAFILPRLCGA